MELAIDSWTFAVNLIDSLISRQWSSVAWAGFLLLSHYLGEWHYGVELLPILLPHLLSSIYCLSRFARIRGFVGLRGYSCFRTDVNTIFSVGFATKLTK